MSQRTEVRVKKTSERRSLRFAGLEFAPPLTAEERAEAEQVLADASASGDYSKVPPPREPTIAVWADEERHHYVLLGDEEGNPVAVRFKIGPVRDPRRDDMAKGGFVPAKTLQAMQPKPKPRAPGAGGGSGGGGAGGGGADPPAPLTEKQQKRKSELLQLVQNNIMGLAQKGAGALLGGLVKEGGSVGGVVENIVAPDGSDVRDMAGKGLVSMGIGGILSAGSGAFFSKVWGVDDSSSTGEQVAHHLAQELAGLMQAEMQKQLEGLLFDAGASSAGTEWTDQFTGMSASEGPPMIRMGDKTDHGGVVQSGEATVLVEGMPAARMTDVQVCPKIESGPVPHVGGTIDQGDPLVVVGGHEAARHDHLSLCTGCGLLAKVVKGQSSVQIGSASTAPPVAKPRQAERAAGAAPPGSRPGKQGRPDKKGGDAPKPDLSSPESNSSPKGDAGSGSNEPESIRGDTTSPTGPEDDSGGVPAADNPSANDHPSAKDAAEVTEHAVKQEAREAAEKVKIAEDEHAKVDARRRSASAEVVSREQALAQARVDADRALRDARATAAGNNRETAEAILKHQKAEEASYKVAQLERQLSIAKDAEAALAKEAGALDKALGLLREQAGLLKGAGKALGVIGDLATVGMGAMEVKEAIQAGDYGKSDAAIGKTGGDLAGSAVGAALGVAAVTALSLTGVGAVVVLGVAVVGGGIAGERLGAAAGSALGGSLTESVVGMGSWLAARIF